MNRTLPSLALLIAFLMLSSHAAKADQVTAVFSCPPDYYAIYEPAPQQDDDTWLQKKDQAADEDDDTDQDEGDAAKGWHCYPLKDLKK